MLPLILGLVVFFAVHLVPSQPALKQGLVDRFGETAFKIGFGAIALIGLAAIVYGYHKMQVMPGKNPVLWDPPTWTRHIAFLLMLPAMILLVAAYVPSRIRTAVKHPMLAAIKIWALAHLLVNGDLASLLLFGEFLGLRRLRPHLGQAARLSRHARRADGAAGQRRDRRRRRCCALCADARSGVTGR